MHDITGAEPINFKCLQLFKFYKNVSYTSIIALRGSIAFKKYINLNEIATVFINHQLPRSA